MKRERAPERRGSGKASGKRWNLAGTWSQEVSRQNWLWFSQRKCQRQVSHPWHSQEPSVIGLKGMRQLERKGSKETKGSEHETAILYLILQATGSHQSWLSRGATNGWPFTSGKSLWWLNREWRGVGRDLRQTHQHRIIIIWDGTEGEEEKGAVPEEGREMLQRWNPQTLATAWIGRRKGWWEGKELRMTPRFPAWGAGRMVVPYKLTG